MWSADVGCRAEPHGTPAGPAVVPFWRHHSPKIEKIML